MVRTPAHLESHEYARRVLAGPFEIELSAFAFELLRSWLDDTRRFVLLAMLNRRVKVVLRGLKAAPARRSAWTRSVWTSASARSVRPAAASPEAGSTAGSAARQSREVGWRWSRCWAERLPQLRSPLCHSHRA